MVLLCLEEKETSNNKRTGEEGIKITPNWDISRPESFYCCQLEVKVGASSCAVSFVGFVYPHNNNNNKKRGDSCCHGNMGQEEESLRGERGHGDRKGERR